MFSFEADKAVIVEQQKALEAALSTNPKAEKVLRGIIRDYILQARSEVVSGIKFKNGDPRGASQAVRTTVYKKILGGNINIFNSRRAHGTNSYEPPRKGVNGRGGNRRHRSQNTQRIMGYSPLDRGFILRFQNQGVQDRHIEFKQDERRSRWPSVPKWNKHINTGFRGNIAPRNFFRTLGAKALEVMRDKIVKVIEEEMTTMIAEGLS